MQVVGRRFSLGLSIAMGKSSAGVQQWGEGALCGLHFVFRCIQTCICIPVSRGGRVSVQSVASCASGQNQVRPIRLPAIIYDDFFTSMVCSGDCVAPDATTSIMMCHVKHIVSK